MARDRRTARVNFYRACKRFKSGKVKSIQFVGKMRDLRLILATVACSPEPPGAA
ncbi:MAG: hypothetical protein ACM3X3_07035 [Betaproteobacteria bacterium]